MSAAEDVGGRGLSLLELLVSITVATLLMTGAYRIFVYFNSQNLTQRRIAQDQGKLFKAQASLEKNLRRAGQGIPLKTFIKNGGSKTAKNAVEILYNSTGSDSIILRGNFNSASSQLRTPLASTATATDLNVLTGTAGLFAVNDYVTIADPDTNEYTQVTVVNTGASTIRTSLRLCNYSAGATVARVTNVQYFVASDSTLKMTRDGTTTVLLNDKVASLKFQMVKSDGTVVSAPPFDVSTARLMQYALTIRISKPKGLYLDRQVTGRILLRVTQ